MDLVDVEKELTAVNSCQSALVVHSSDWLNGLLRMLFIKFVRNGDSHAKQVVDNFPDSSLVHRDGDHEITVVRKLQTRDSFTVLVLDLAVIEELLLVQLDNVKDFLGLLELLADLQVLETVGVCHARLGRSDVLLEDSHACLTLSHRNEQVSVQSFTLTWHAEDEFVHLADELGVRDPTCAPAVHAEVTL